MLQSINSTIKKIFLACMIFTSSLLAEGTDSSAQSIKNRVLSFTGGVGTYELVRFGIQYQYSSRFSFGLSYSNSFTDSQFFVGDHGSGVGMKLTYYFNPTGINNFLFVNALTIEPSSAIGKHSRKYYFINAAIGHESIVSRELGFYWYLGIVNRTGNSQQAIFGSLKMGIHFGF